MLPQWHSPQSTRCSCVPAGKRPPGAQGGGLPEPLRSAKVQSGSAADWRSPKSGDQETTRRGPARWRLMGVDVFPCRAPRRRGQQSPRKVTLAAWPTRSRSSFVLWRISADVSCVLSPFLHSQRRGALRR